MVERPSALRSAQGDAVSGAVAGFTLKLLRESAGLTQVTLAEQLGVDPTTVQGWESGRRPLAALRTIDLRALRLHLIVSGVRPDVVAVLDHAIDADLLLHPTNTSGRHPLGSIVHQRASMNVLTWPFTGRAPELLGAASVRTRPGPSPDRPVVGASQRNRFFDDLLAVLDEQRHHASGVLRRQAVYLLGFDVRATTRTRLHEEQRAAVRRVDRHDDVASWVAVRSAAVALAEDGDGDPLSWFVARGLSEQRQQLANLNYWAYWVGEIPGTATNDAFMSDPQAGWSGARLAGHLLDRLDVTSPHLGLHVHTMWSLLLARPRLFEQHPALRGRTLATAQELLDHSRPAGSTRHELVGLVYAARLAQP